MRCAKFLGLLQVACVALLALTPVSAEAQSVRINKLADFAFGSITNFSIDQRRRRSICVFTTPLGTRYRVTATGSGAGGAFTLVSGGSTMPYEVEWAAASGQTTGTALTSGVALTNLSTNATVSGCTSGPATSASLIAILRSATVSAARSGSYRGTLTLLIAPN
jgi:hypothetical protein